MSVFIINITLVLSAINVLAFLFRFTSKLVPLRAGLQRDAVRKRQGTTLQPGSEYYSVAFAHCGAGCIEDGVVLLQV